MSEVANKLVQLDVSESVLILQDKGNIQLKIVVEKKTRSEVQKELKEKAGQVFKALKKHEKLEAFTVQQSIHDKYKEVSNKHVKDGYEGFFIIGVTGYDFNELNIAVEEVENLAQVSHVETSISSKLKKEQESELTQKAIKAFKEKAMLVTKSFDFKDFVIDNINVASSRAEHHNVGAMAFSASLMARSATGASQVEQELFFIEPRQERVSVGVSGSVKLINKMLD